MSFGEARPREGGCRCRSRSGETAIVHPSSKTAGKWQVSFFDEHGPSRDSQHSNVADALAQVSPKRWRLKTLG